MKIVLKYGNYVKTYPNVDESERWLNEMNYYCERLELVYSFEDSVVYGDDTDLEYLQREANIYGEGWIKVIDIHE